MKTLSQLINEVKVEWISHPELKPESDGATVSLSGVPSKLKTDGPKKPQPERHKECKTCEGTGETRNLTGRVGVDKETGVVHVQRLKQGCTTCSGKGHINPNPSSRPPDNPYYGGRYNTGAGRATWTGD